MYKQPEAFVARLEHIFNLFLAVSRQHLTVSNERSRRDDPSKVITCYKKINFRVMDKSSLCLDLECSTRQSWNTSWIYI